jgi:hypothetical protein
MSDNILTQERLKELLSYDPETGVFVRIKQTSSKAKIGDVAGTTKRNGYRRISADGKCFSEHRLAWFYMTGEFPPNEIDHIDRNPANNRFANLRVVTRSENMQNVGKYKCNTSGYKGVSYQKCRKKWRAQIEINNVCKEIGRFATPEEASAAYLAAQRIYHPTCPTI